MTTIYSAVRDVLKAWPSRQPVVVDAALDRAYLPKDLLRLIDEYARFLTTAAVRPGDTVLLMARNSVAWPAIALACRRIGAMVAPIKADWRVGELTSIVPELRPAAIVIDEELLALFPKSRSRLFVLDPLSHELTVATALEQDPGDASGVPHLDLRHVPLPEEAHHPRESIASINYTYRGLGYPIGAMIPDRQYLSGAEIFVRGMDGTYARRMLVFLPMAHIFTLVGCVFAPLFAGMTTYYLPSVLPQRVFECIHRYDIDFVTTVPEVLALLTRFAGQRGVDVPLDIIATGGSVLDAGEYAAARQAFGCEVLHGYGLTEMTPVSRNIRGNSRPGTVGPVATSLDVRMDKDTGEILLRGDDLFAGYFRRPSVSREATNQEGWFRTGDAGHFVGGHLVFDHEIKKTCKANGAMVDINEVKAFLESIPFVEAAEISTEESRLTATVTVAKHTPPEEVAGLRKRLSPYLAPYKIPRVFQK